MATPNPALDVATKLVGTVGGVALTLGTNLFVGPVRPVDVNAGLGVFVLSSGGAPPVPILGVSKSYHTAAVQVRVRSAAGDFAGGSVLARAILRALHAQTVASTVSGASYVVCLARSSEPLYMGADDAERHEWAVNVELQHDD